MTNVINLASVRPGTYDVHTSAQTPRPNTANQGTAIARQQAIENSLSMALYWIRHDEHPGNIYAATVRAVRAASMLKQACREVGTGGRVAP